MTKIKDLINNSEDLEKFREKRRKKKQRNKKFSRELLQEKNIPFESFKNGEKLCVKYNGYVIDFWPATGLFIDQESGYKSRGIYHLIDYLNGKQEKK